MWALGAVVHQMLTSEIPFTEIGPTNLDSTYQSTTSDFTDQSMTPGSSVDGEMLLDYCAGRESFPVAGLTRHRASATSIAFVKRLMIPNPKDRVSAADALPDRWLSGLISTALPESDTAATRQRSLSLLAIERVPPPSPKPAPPLYHPTIPSYITPARTTPQPHDTLITFAPGQRSFSELAFESAPPPSLKPVRLPYHPTVPAYITAAQKPQPNDILILYVARTIFKQMQY